MKHRVKQVFERDLDELLTRLDQEGSEVIRILDIPKGKLTSADCALCEEGNGKLCEDHLSEVYRMRMMSSDGPVVLDRKQIWIFLPRYAVVYKESETSVWMDILRHPGDLPITGREEKPK